MKLNNKGWGYGTMFLLMSVLIIALIVVWAYSYKIHYQLEDLNKTNNYQYYKNLEIRLKNSGEYYINLKKYDCSINDCIISYQELKSEQMVSEILDKQTKKECAGYVASNGSTTKAYVSCDNYVTEGY